MKNIDEQVQGFLDFVNASPSAFHAVQSAKERLLAQGFVQIKENEEWKLKAGEKYFFTRNHSSIFAFVVGGKYVRTLTLLRRTATQLGADRSSPATHIIQEAGNGINISAAHTDSPNLKVKRHLLHPPLHALYAHGPQRPSAD